MAVVCAHVSGRRVSRVFRSRWSNEVQLHEVGFSHQDMHTSRFNSGTFRHCLSCLALGLDQRKEVIMRDADACSARSYSISQARAGRIGRVSYLFMGEHGEYYGGDCMWFGLIQSHGWRHCFSQCSKTRTKQNCDGFLVPSIDLLGAWRSRFGCANGSCADSSG